MEVTWEEKKQKIQDFCDLHDEDCMLNGERCPLHEKHCLSDDCVEEHYDFIIDHEKVEEDKLLEAVDHPSHYNTGGMECIDEMVLIFGVEAVKHFCLCNAWKYRYRAMDKNGKEDMEKSHWYIAKYKELSENDRTQAF